jgi:hypothetical protein
MVLKKQVNIYVSMIASDHLTYLLDDSMISMLKYYLYILGEKNRGNMSMQYL